MSCIHNLVDNTSAEDIINTVVVILLAGFMLTAQLLMWS